MRSAAVLTYIARGTHADVALLYITRGEGGRTPLAEQARNWGLSAQEFDGGQHGVRP